MGDAAKLLTQVDTKREQFLQATSGSFKAMRESYKAKKSAVKDENTLLGLQAALFAVATVGSIGFFGANGAAFLGGTFPALFSTLGSVTLGLANGGNLGIAIERMSNDDPGKQILLQIQKGDTRLAASLTEFGKLVMLIAAESKLPGKTATEMEVFDGPNAEKNARAAYPMDDLPVERDGRIGYYGIQRIKGHDGDLDEFRIVFNSWSTADFDKFLGKKS